MGTLPADPKPELDLFDSGGERPRAHANPYGPCIISNLLELNGGVKRASAPEPVHLAGQSTDLRCECSTGFPEGLVRVTGHGSRWVFPAWKSDSALSIKRRNGPPGRASSAIRLSQARALYSANHSARRSTALGASFSISAWISSMFRFYPKYPRCPIDSSDFPATPMPRAPGMGLARRVGLPILEGRPAVTFRIRPQLAVDTNKSKGK